MNNQQRHLAVQCPCGFEIQNVQHVLSGTCEYMEEWLDEMYAAISEILQSEGESVQQRWMVAQNMVATVKLGPPTVKLAYYLT